MSKYSKNFILLGDLDHHCLLCKESFHTVDNLEKHIRWEKHRKILKGLSPMPKFKMDRIFKLEDMYFCEHCNQVFTTITEVTKHIGDEYHQKNKALPDVDLKPSHCKRDRQSGLIVIGNNKDIIKITNKEWYGVIDSKCIFCDVVVDNFVKHISLSSHMIATINSEIIQNEGGLFYRVFKDKHGYCFLCKKTFSIQSKSDHWKDELHIEKTKALNEMNAKTDQEKKVDVAIKLINSQKEYFTIDLENKVAICKICTAYININFKFMIEHKKIHNITDKDKIEQAPVDMDEVFKSLKCKNPDKDNDKSFWYDHGKLRAELAKFGRENFIKLVFPGGKGYCSLCSTYISAHMRNFTEHVRGQIHMGHLELKGLDTSGKPHATKPSHRTKKMKNFIKSINHSKELQVLWINKEFCLDILSFMLVSMINDVHSNKFKCYACDSIYNHDNEVKHCASEKHQEYFLNSEVIIAIQGELIREIRPNVYHCAVCNLIFPFWETLEKHLNSWKHICTKQEREDMLTERIEELAVACSNLTQDRLFATLISMGLIDI